MVKISGSQRSITSDAAHAETVGRKNRHHHKKSHRHEERRSGGYRQPDSFPRLPDPRPSPVEIGDKRPEPQTQPYPQAPVHDSSGKIQVTPKEYRDLVDQALIKALRDAHARHDALGYNEARQVIFSVLDNIDGKVTCAYTGRQIKGGAIPNNADMNVEHTWPKSKGAKQVPAKSDLHHLHPTDSRTNSTRSSYPFGEVVKVLDPCSGGSKFGLDADGREVFEVRPQHRGNVARAMFYFSVVYGKPIEAHEEATLRKWNKEDAVDDAERRRNDLIDSMYQHNRNPFVDDPSLVDRISDF